MLDLKTLDVYLDEYKEFVENLSTDNVLEEIQKDKNLSIRERCILKMFFSGFQGTHLLYEKVNTLILTPTTSEVDPNTLSICKEGIQENFLDKVGLDFEIQFGEYSKYFEPYLDSFHLSTDRGLELDAHQLNYAILGYFQRIETLPLVYFVLVDNSEFIFGKSARLAGEASTTGSAVLLERALKKGRHLNGDYTHMTADEKTGYMKSVAAHEVYHLLGLLSDDHLGLREFPDKKDCLGYSRFKMPAVICESCIDEIRALWYGVEIREGKNTLNRIIFFNQFLNPLP